MSSFHLKMHQGTLLIQIVESGYYLCIVWESQTNLVSFDWFVKKIYMYLVFVTFIDNLFEINR